MHRVRLILGVVAVVGSEGCREAFRAHANVAAEASGQTLKTDRLASMMTRAKGMKATPEAAEFVANMWIDYTLFARAVANHTPLTDSASAAAALWPEIAEARGTRWHDLLLARRGKIAPEAA